MNVLKKLTALVLALTVVIGVSSIATASTNSDISTYAWQQLGSTSNTFTVDDDGKATIIGTTSGRGNSTKVTLDVYVERLNKGTWSTVSGMSWSSSSTSEIYLSISKTRWMTSGYYYRLRTEHSATGPNGTETDTIISDIYYYGG